jgi:hypothetical protein
VNPPEMRVLDCEEFRCTRNVGEIHGRHFTATNSLSSSGSSRERKLGPSKLLINR